MAATTPAAPKRAAKKPAPKPGAAKRTATKTEARSVDVKVIPRKAIVVVDDFNPRTIIQKDEFDELVESVRARGVLAAITVASLPGGKYKLIGGHRRVAAGDVVGLTEYPAVIRESGDDDLVDAIVDNKHRADLTPIEEAIAFGRLRDEHGLTPKGIAEKCGVSLKLVSDRLQILLLPDNARQAIADGRLSTAAVSGLAKVAEKTKSGCELLVRFALADNDDDVRKGAPYFHYDLAGTLARPNGWYEVLSHLAESLAGKELVELYGGESAGGHMPGTYPSHASVDVAEYPDLRKALSKEARDAYNALHGADVHRYYAYQVNIDVAVLDQLDAAGVLLRNPEQARSGICWKADSLAALLEPLILADHKKWMRSQAARARELAKRVKEGTATTAERAAAQTEQERADEKAKAYKAMQDAHAANLALGEQLTRHFGSVELTMDTARLLGRAILEGGIYGESANVARQLALRGLRYVLPQWQLEITQTNGKKKLRVPGDGTVAPKTLEKPDEHPSSQDAETLFWEWWNLATTPQEVLGRTLIALAAARYANQDAIPASRHSYYSVDRGSTYGGRRKNAEFTERLDKLVKPKVEKKTPAKRGAKTAKAS